MQTPFIQFNDEFENCIDDNKIYPLTTTETTNAQKTNAT
jgi:hypothetical protein